MNQIKGAFAGFKASMSPDKMRDYYYDSITGVTDVTRDKARTKWMSEIQKVCSNPSSFFAFSVLTLHPP